MNIIERYVSSEREKRAREEAKRVIRIEDYGDEICITIDGIKARTITGNIPEDVETLKQLREAYVNRTKEH